MRSIRAADSGGGRRSGLSHLVAASAASNGERFGSPTDGIGLRVCAGRGCWCAESSPLAGVRIVVPPLADSVGAAALSPLASSVGAAALPPPAGFVDASALSPLWFDPQLASSDSIGWLSSG